MTYSVLMGTLNSTHSLTHSDTGRQADWKHCMKDKQSVYAGCQVCRRIDEEDAVGWVPAHVKMMKGEFVVIDYIQATHSVTDIVNVDLVRLPSKMLVSCVDENLCE